MKPRDWMSMKGLSQAIPPAYAEFIGIRAMEEIWLRRDHLSRLA